MRFIVDTCIWMDFLQQRKHGSQAAGFIMQAMNDHELLISDAILRELNESAWGVALLPLTKIGVTIEQIKEAKEISRTRNLPFVDCLIACQARDNHATVITRDKHFRLLNDIANSSKPEDINLD